MHGRNALMAAVYQDDEVAVNFFLSKGMPQLVESEHGWTCLHIAAARAGPGIIAALLAHGADRQARDLHGFRAKTYGVGRLVSGGGSAEHKARISQLLRLGDFSSDLHHEDRELDEKLRAFLTKRGGLRMGPRAAAATAGLPCTVELKELGTQLIPRELLGPESHPTGSVSATAGSSPSSPSSATGGAASEGGSAGEKEKKGAEHVASFGVEQAKAAALATLVTAAGAEKRRRETLPPFTISGGDADDDDSSPAARVKKRAAQVLAAITAAASGQLVKLALLVEAEELGANCSIEDGSLAAASSSSGSAATTAGGAAAGGAGASVASASHPSSKHAGVTVTPRPVADFIPALDPEEESMEPSDERT